MKEGEIWTVQFTGQGHEYQGLRPAVIIQSEAQLKVSIVITVMPLSTKKEKRHKDGIFIRKSEKNGLFRDSIIKVHQIQSFDNSRFKNKMGVIESEILFEIKQYLQKHFGV